MCPLFEGGVAEEVIDAPGCQDQVVVTERAAIGIDPPTGKIDIDHPPEAEVSVSLMAEDGTGRVSHLSGVEQRGGHLVEQGLEEVVVC